MATVESEHYILPPEINTETAHQMALYANVAELELVTARTAMAAAQKSLDVLQQQIENLGPKDKVVIRDEEFSTLVGDRAIVTALMVKKSRVQLEQRWVHMLQHAAHYRALHGRHDHKLGVDEAELYNYADAVSCQYKSELLLQSHDQWPPYASYPDYLAINCLLKVGAFETIAEAFATTSPKGYSSLAREALRHANSMLQHTQEG